MINEIKRRSRKAGTIKRTREIWRDTVARSRYGYTVSARTSENYTSVAFLYGRESGALSRQRVLYVDFLSSHLFVPTFIKR